MKKNGYSINHDNKTITLTKVYAKVANTPGTKEFRELTRLHKAFPDYDIVMRSATVNENKEKHDGLTIDFMTDYIKKIVKDEAIIAEFEAVKAYYKGMNGYYGKVKGWFLKKYKEEYQKVDFSKLVEKAEPEAQASASEEIAA